MIVMLIRHDIGQLVLKVMFDKVNPNSYCAPNLKSLASTVAEISRAYACVFKGPFIATQLNSTSS